MQPRTGVQLSYSSMRLFGVDFRDVHQTELFLLESSAAVQESITMPNIVLRPSVRRFASESVAIYCSPSPRSRSNPEVFDARRCLYSLAVVFLASAFLVVAFFSVSGASGSCANSDTFTPFSSITSSLSGSCSEPWT